MDSVVVNLVFMAICTFNVWGRWKKVRIPARQ